MDDKELKKLEKQRLNFIKNTLRRASYRWPPRDEALRLARVARGLYKCATCQVDTFKRSEVELDHVDPVVGIEDGFTDITVYAIRLFPLDATGYQVLCKTCHAAKTQIEDEMRAYYNAERKFIEKEKKRLDKQTKKVIE